MQIPYLEEAIDMSNPYAQKYMEVIGSPATEGITETHHIVPVAYYQDVLGNERVRLVGTPDMNRNNLVDLSYGRHLLAHYYLSKCANPCIKVQMDNAFCLMYQTFDMNSVTDEEVIAKADELDCEYKHLKKRPRVHKDGKAVTVHNTCIRLDNWKDGNLCGLSIKWTRGGNVLSVYDRNQDLKVYIDKWGSILFQAGGHTHKYGWPSVRLQIGNMVGYSIEASGQGGYCRFGVSNYNHTENSVVMHDCWSRALSWLPYSNSSDAVREYFITRCTNDIRKLISSAREIIENIWPEKVDLIPQEFDNLVSLYGDDSKYATIAIPELPWRAA